MLENCEAYKHLNESEKKVVMDYAKNVIGYINILDVSKERKEDLFKTLTEYKANREAADHYAKIYNNIADQMEKLYKAYQEEPNDAKARKYLEKYNKLKVDLQRVLNKYNYFEGKRAALEEKALKDDKFIDEQLVKGVGKAWDKRNETQKKFNKKK